MHESTDIKNPVDENPFVFIDDLLAKLYELVAPYGGNISLIHDINGIRVMGTVYRKNDGYSFTQIIPRGDFHARMGVTLLRERIVETVYERVEHAVRELDAKEDTD